MVKMKHSSVWQWATIILTTIVGVSILLEYNGLIEPRPLTVELIGTTIAVTLGLSIAEFGRTLAREDSEEVIRRRLLKELTRLATGDGHSKGPYYYPVWESVIQTGRDSLLDDTFLEGVFDIYNDINFWNRRLDRQSCLSYEAIPVVEKIRDFVKIHGEKEHLEKIESKLESLREMDPNFKKEKEGE